jgi:hypothetical protein
MITKTQNGNSTFNNNVMVTMVTKFIGSSNYTTMFYYKLRHWDSIVTTHIKILKYLD